MPIICTNTVTSQIHHDDYQVNKLFTLQFNGGVDVGLLVRYMKEYMQCTVLTCCAWRESHG